MIFYKKFYICVFLFFSFTPIFYIFSEAESVEPTDTNNPGHSKPPIQTSELKYESGDVTINFKNAANQLKKKSEINYASIETTLLNRKKEEDLNKLQNMISQGNTSLIRGEYKSARRLFKMSILEMEIIATDINQSYMELFLKYTETLNANILKLKKEKPVYDPNPYLIPHLEKRAAEAGDMIQKAEFLSQSGKNIKASHFYRNSLRELLEANIRASQEFENKPLATDHLDDNDRIIYDEVRNLDHKEEDEKRELTRKRWEELKNSKKNSRNDSDKTNEESNTTSNPFSENSESKEKQDNPN